MTGLDNVEKIICKTFKDITFKVESDPITCAKRLRIKSEQQTARIFSESELLRNQDAIIQDFIAEHKMRRAKDNETLQEILTVLNEIFTNSNGDNDAIIEHKTRALYHNYIQYKKDV